MARIPQQYDSKSIFVSDWAIFGRSAGDVVTGSTYTCPPKRAAIVDGWVTHKDNTLQSQVAMMFGRNDEWMEVERSYYYYTHEDHRQKFFMQAGDQVRIVAQDVTDQEFGPQRIRAT